MVHLLAVVDDAEEEFLEILQQQLLMMVSMEIFQILQEKSEGFQQVETHHFDHKTGLLIVAVLHFVQDPRQIDLYSQ
jgi:hypothetical protein